MISALNRPHELKLHIKAALIIGLSREQIRETPLQLAIYCGERTFAELDRTRK